MKLEQVIAERKNKKVYRDGDTAVKLFESGFSKADILNEALNQARVEETGLNIPKIRGVSMIDGKWAIISDFIEGKTLEQLMKEHPEKEDEYLNLFVSVQMTIHTMRSPLLPRLRDKMFRKISLADLDPSTQYDLHTRLESMPRHNKVCHGDFNPSNLIITPEGTSYILDWSHATQGNASADVARTYLMFCLDKKKALAEKYLDLFVEKSGTDKRYIQRWMPIVAASQSVKGNKKERDFLLSWAEVMDFE